VTLALQPQQSTNEVATTISVRATVTNHLNEPLSGVRVDFLVTGSNNGRGFAFTDEDGKATFYFSGTNLGSDTIRASVGSISAFSTNTWALPSFALNGYVTDD